MYRYQSYHDRELLGVLLRACVVGLPAICNSCSNTAAHSRQPHCCVFAWNPFLALSLDASLCFWLAAATLVQLALM